jgi:hypothetical protein
MDVVQEETRLRRVLVYVPLVCLCMFKYIHMLRLYCNMQMIEEKRTEKRIALVHTGLMRVREHVMLRVDSRDGQAHIPQLPCICMRSFLVNDVI